MSSYSRTHPPVSDWHLHIKLDECDLDDFSWVTDECVEDAVDARPVDLRIIGRRKRSVVTTWTTLQNDAFASYNRRKKNNEK